MDQEEECGLMPVVTFKRSYLGKLVGAKLSDTALSNVISKLGLGVETIDAHEVGIEVASNRPDLLSAVGVARAIRYFNHRNNRFDYRIKDQEPFGTIRVGKKIGKVRPFIASLQVGNLHFTDDSLTELLGFLDKFCETYGRSRRKIAIGMHDLSKVDITTLEYDLYEDTRFVPLNVNEDVYFSKVLKTMEKGIKYSDLIFGGRKGFPALRDSKGVLALIPIINSERTRVTVSTKSALIDITGTSDYLVRRTAALLATIFIDIGAEVRRMKISYERSSVMTPQLEEEMMQIPIARVEETIGVRIGPNNTASLAEKMGYRSSYIGTKLNVSIPPYRLDIINEQDVIEDIAIGYGYDYIRPIPVRGSQAGTLEAYTILRQKLEEAMLGLGFSQMMNSYLSNEDVNFKKMRLYDDKNHISIKNPKMSSITMLRTWVLPSLLKNGGMSQGDKMPQKMFELDMVFDIEGTGIMERYNLAAVSVDSKANFNYIKSVLEAVAESFSIKFESEPFEHASFIEGRCARIKFGGKAIGVLGEVHPEILASFGIEEPTVAFELDTSFLVRKDRVSSMP